MEKSENVPQSLREGCYIEEVIIASLSCKHLTLKKASAVCKEYLAPRVLLNFMVATDMANIHQFADKKKI